MLHHFPTRFDLISAAIAYLSDRWLQRFTEAETRVNEGAEHTRVQRKESTRTGHC